MSAFCCCSRAWSCWGLGICCWGVCCSCCGASAGGVIMDNDTGTCSMDGHKRKADENPKLRLNVTFSDPEQRSLQNSAAQGLTVTFRNVKTFFQHPCLHSSFSASTNPEQTNQARRADRGQRRMPVLHLHNKDVLNLSACFLCMWKTCSNSQTGLVYTRAEPKCSECCTQYRPHTFPLTTELFSNNWNVNLCHLEPPTNPNRFCRFGKTLIPNEQIHKRCVVICDSTIMSSTNFISPLTVTAN